jgi:hypothetical protein
MATAILRGLKMICVICNLKIGQILHTHSVVDAHNQEISHETLFTVLNPSIHKSKVGVAGIQTTLEPPSGVGTFWIDLEIRKLKFRGDGERSGAGARKRATSEVGSQAVTRLDGFFREST